MAAPVCLSSIHHAPQENRAAPRDLNQLSVYLLVVCLMTTTVGEAYLVRTIGRRSESQSTRPKSVLSGSPSARQCRTAYRPPVEKYGFWKPMFSGCAQDAALGEFESLSPHRNF